MWSPMVRETSQDVLLAAGRPSQVPRSSGPSATVDSQCRTMFSCISGSERKASLDDGLSHFHRRYSERGPTPLRGPARTSSDKALLPQSRRPDGRRRLDEWISHLVTDEVYKWGDKLNSRVGCPKGYNTGSKAVTPAGCNNSCCPPLSLAILSKKMPIFSWKARLLGRKTPEPERAVHVVNQQRNVRFQQEPDFSNDYGEARLIGSICPASGNSVRLTNSLPHEQAWRPNEICVAPLARQDDEELSRPGLRVPPSRRNDLNVFSETSRGRNDGPVYVEPPNVNDGIHLQKMNVVFLQAHDEVKRAILPPDISTLYQVKMAFLRAFPNINRHFIDQPQVKIYIQEPSKSQLFYELEDPRDISDRSVLRLRDQSGSVSPMPFGPGIDHPDYHSENEIDNPRRARNMGVPRPASAMAEFIPQKPPRRRAFEDDSSQGSGTRSGSVTPVIVDRESRERMETMERQLAGLSSLVHSALVSKGMNERAQKDMAHLRKEILALHADPRESSEEPASLPESISSHTQHQLHDLSGQIQQAKNDVRQLRRIAQVNAQTARSLLREAGDQITRIVVSHQTSGVSKEYVPFKVTTKGELQRQQEVHASHVTSLLNSLTSLENEVEAVRAGVLNSNKKLRMTEVEQLTIRLARLGGEAAELKQTFAPLQSKIEETIKSYMEKILREEKLIKEQTLSVDQSLRRCKALANIMVTMKKLAMVQDPALQKLVKEEPTSSIDPAFERPAVFTPNPPSKTVAIVAPPPIMTTSLPVLSNGHQEVPPVPPPPPSFNPVAGLDGVLKEVGKPGVPPRPPSRFSVQDVRTKFTKPPELPEQLKHIIEDAIHSSPTPEQKDPIAERRQELEQRQERLAEKQKMLRNQFLQLQQYSSATPPPNPSQKTF